MAKNKKRKHNKNKNKVKKPTMADTADRHQLYENTVQCVESEIDFVDGTFKKIRGRRGQLLREDFCGTFAASCEWIGRRDDNVAIGVDIDAAVQEWGKQHNLVKLNDTQQQRMHLLTEDVMQVQTEPVDIVLAMNFSYWYFKERAVLRDYFSKVHGSLKDDGIFFMDCFGGYEAFEEMTEERDEDEYTYIWDQAKYNPITGEILCHIHFKFPDGSKMKKAFTYDWRLWTLPELQEILREAGFSKVTVYWDMADDEDEDDFQPSMEGEADAGWLAYIVSEK
jgi:cyclopropane fatty-acyl-phospholipid synthase-like methyltransferase